MAPPEHLDEGTEAPVEDVVVRRLPIRLGQLLKLAGLVGSGGEAAARLGDAEVSVNGTVETRRGRMVHHGDVVGFAGRSLRIVEPGSPPPPAARP